MDANGNFDLRKEVACPNCGKLPRRDGKPVCPDCGGRGNDGSLFDSQTGEVIGGFVCPTCNGHGFIHCYICGNKGLVSENTMMRYLEAEEAKKDSVKFMKLHSTL